MTQAAAADDLRVDAASASLRGQVEARLREAIVTGRFAPGAHLTDRTLCETFRVSRTLVREAVRRLEAEGLVETLPHRGSFVRGVSAEEARQIYDVRGVLEALAAREFAARAGEEDVARLKQALAAIAEAARAPASGDLVALKQRFYAVLLAGCGNAYVETMLNQILNRNTQLRATSLSDPERLPRTLDELRRLVAAIERRDPQAAWEASLEHVGNAARVALAILERNETDHEPPETPHG